MSIPAALDCTCWKYVQAVQYVQGAKFTVRTRARYEGEWRCLRRRVRGLDRLRAAFDLEVLDRFGAALHLDGLYRFGVVFDPEACHHRVGALVVIELLIDLSLSSKLVVG